MEDENYRNMILAKLNKAMDKRVAPDDHIQDIVRTCHIKLFHTLNKTLFLVPKEISL